MNVPSALIMSSRVASARCVESRPEYEIEQSATMRRTTGTYVLPGTEAVRQEMAENRHPGDAGERLDQNQRVPLSVKGDQRHGVDLPKGTTSYETYHACPWAAQPKPSCAGPSAGRE